MQLSLAHLAVLILAIPLVVILVSNTDRLPLAGRWRRQFFSDRWFEALTFAGSFACLLLSIVLVKNSPKQPLVFSFLGFDLLMDSLSVYFIFLVNIVAFFASWNAFASPSG